MEIISPYTKVYLKDCRGSKEKCLKKFYTTQANKQYCSPWCRHESIREKGKERVRRFRKKYKNEGTGRKVPNWLGTNSNFKEEYETQDPSYLGVPIRFYNESLSIQDIKKETFVTCSSEGGLPPIPLIPYQGVTFDDLYQLSTSYLKENNLKCPECGNKQNLVERALLVCSNPKCGLVLGAPVLHPGFVLYDLTPIKKIAPTVQDFTIDFTEKNKKSRKAKSVEVVKEAHDSAYQKYEKETGSMFDDLKEYSENDPLNPTYWKYYEKKKIYNKS